MNILRHHCDMETGDLIVMTDQSRYPVRVYRHEVENSLENDLEWYVREELAWRQRLRLFRDNRHDGWKGARQPWVSA